MGTESQFWATYSGNGVRVSGHTVCKAFTLVNNGAVVFNDGGDGENIGTPLQTVAAARTLRQKCAHNGLPVFVAAKMERHSAFTVNPDEMHLFFNTLRGAWIVARAIPIADKHDTLKTDTAVEPDAGDPNRQHMVLVHRTEQNDVDAIRPTLRYEGAVAYCMTIPKRDMRTFRDATRHHRVTAMDAPGETVGVSILSFRLASDAVSSVSDVYAVAMFTVDKPDALEAFSPRPWNDSMCSVWRARGECLRLADGGPGMAPVPDWFGLRRVETAVPMETDPTADEALFASRLLADFQLKLLHGKEERVHRALMYSRNALLGMITRMQVPAFEMSIQKLAADTVLSVVYTGRVVEHVYDKWLRLGPSVPEIAVVASARTFAYLAGVAEAVEPLVALYVARNTCLHNAVDMVVLLTWLVRLRADTDRMFAPFRAHPLVTKRPQPKPGSPIEGESTELVTGLRNLDGFITSIMNINLDVINGAPPQTRDYINQRLAVLNDARLLADDLRERMAELVGTMKREQDAYARAGWIVHALDIVFSYPTRVPGVQVDHTLKDIRKLDVEFSPDPGGWITPIRKRGIKYIPREVTHRKPLEERPTTPPGFWELDFP